jgi:3-isopropylmalate/(R)-2-methylmalate dehydratase small subunit
MSQIQLISGRGLPLVGDDIDTDRIIPARFLKSITFDGLGEHVFEDDRHQLKGQHPFDLPEYKGASILVVNQNFGCGSSREHAPQALARWGIRAVIGESFAEIFFGNCVAIGLPCVTAEAALVEQLQAALTTNSQTQLTLNLATLTVQWGDRTEPLTMGEGPRQMFLSGSWDACGQLIAQATQIRTTAARIPYFQYG